MKLSFLFVLLLAALFFPSPAVDFQNTLQTQTISQYYEVDQEFYLNLEDIVQNNLTFNYEFSGSDEGCSLLDGTLTGSIDPVLEASFNINERIYLTDDYLYSVLLQKSDNEQVVKLNIFGFNKYARNLVSPRVIASTQQSVEFLNRHIQKILQYNGTLIIASQQDLIVYNISNPKSPEFLHVVSSDTTRITDMVILDDRLIILKEDSIEIRDLKSEDFDSLVAFKSYTLSDITRKVETALQIKLCSDIIYLIYPQSIAFLKFNIEENSIEGIGELEVAAEIFQVEISQRAVWVLSKDHIYEYLIRDNCAHITENQILILSQFTGSSRNSSYKLLSSSETNSSKFFALFDNSTNSLNIMKHSKSQNTGSYAIYSQKWDRSDIMHDFAFSWNMSSFFAISFNGLSYGRLTYNPITVYCTASPGHTLNVKIDAKGSFCSENLYNFTDFMEEAEIKSIAELASPYVYSDPMYFNPDKLCVRSIHLSLNFKWPGFILFLMVFGVVTLLCCAIFVLLMVRSHLKKRAEGEPGVPPLKLPNLKYEIQQDLPTDPRELNTTPDQTNFMYRAEMAVTPTVTKRDTGELSFGPDEDEIARRIKQYEDKNRAQPEFADI